MGKPELLRELWGKDGGGRMTDETRITIEKIRDKIIADADYEDEYDDQDIAKGLYKAVEIIDKCMAESEDKA